MDLPCSTDFSRRKLIPSSAADPGSLSGFLSSGARLESTVIKGITVTKYIKEFWTPRQRQGSSIHEISYRACFKPQLPRFFIELFSGMDSIIYDPFSGRGTTVIEAGILGHKIVSNDASPLTLILTRPRFAPPDQADIESRISSIAIDGSLRSDIDLSMFFHDNTLQEILSLKKYLYDRALSGEEDDVDRWISMVATNRLTGHSKGFFSVYTLPPNQAVSPESQKRINKRRKQEPEYRNTKDIIIRKTKSLLRTLTVEHLDNLKNAGRSAIFLNREASDTPEIESQKIQLTVTSPPFLDVVQYSKDNWLRLWFNSLDPVKSSANITMARTVQEWSAVMASVFRELYRITKHGGWLAFEVGEVKNQTINLDEHVAPLGIDAGFECLGILINSQEFSKTSNIWGVKNMTSGTNTNRIVLFRKP